MHKAGKVWGITRTIFDKCNVEIHIIDIECGGFCSKHKHTHKYNGFYVIDGQMKISVWRNDYDIIDYTIVTKGDFVIVSPNEYHMFEAITNVKALEIYWVEIDKNDIIRETCGGK